MSARHLFRLSCAAGTAAIVFAGCASAPATITSAWGTGTALPRPVRPEVAPGRDPKDPFTFVALGTGMLMRGRADSASAAFFWASRIDPTLAYPYYGRSVALLLAYARPVQDFSGTEVWVPAAKIPGWRLVVIDSLRREALARDPFLRADYDFLLTGRPPFALADRARDPAVRGYWMYEYGHLPVADSLLGVALQAKPKLSQLRAVRARAEYELGRYDSAVVQLHILLDTLSHRDSSSLALAYSSKEMIYYALGYAEAKRGDTTAARIAFESAIDENAAFYPAHSRLAALAVNRNDLTAAIRELAVATQVAPDDPTLLYFHAATLLDGRQPGQAVAELLKAIDLDPYFAKPYLLLGKAHEARGDTERAAEAYDEYAAVERVSAPERTWAQAYADTLRTRLAKTR